MDQDTIIIAKIKAQILKFSGIISKEFSKPKRRLNVDGLYNLLFPGKTGLKTKRCDTQDSSSASTFGDNG
jgi:hypothetical protein